MNTLMLALQQPLSKDTLAAWAARLGWPASRPAARPVRRRKARVAVVRAADAPETPLAAADSLEDTLACGWFDSSHELHQGLVVLEHSAADGLGAELPITVWLDLVLKAPEARSQPAFV